MIESDGTSRPRTSRSPTTRRPRAAASPPRALWCSSTAPSPITPSTPTGSGGGTGGRRTGGLETLYNTIVAENTTQTTFEAQRHRSLRHGIDLARQLEQPDRHRRRRHPRRMASTTISRGSARRAWRADWRTTAARPKQSPCSPAVPPSTRALPRSAARPFRPPTSAVRSAGRRGSMRQRT